MSARTIVNLEALRPWLAERLGVADVELRDVRRHIEGFSWETYTFTACWQQDGEPRELGLAVRREPEDGLLAPYDIRGQYRLHEGLERDTRLPVPRLRWLELDPSVLGMPFYVMDRVHGHVPVQWKPDDPVAFPTPGRRTAIGERFVDALAELHATPPEKLGFSVPAGTAEEAALAEVEHWYRYCTENAVRRVPLLEEAAAWLREHVAVSGRLVLCHGDYRIGNFMLDEQGEIIAVFDWELAHVSDPVEDIAWAALRLFRGRSPLWSHLLEPAAFLARYEERTGLAVRPEMLKFWTVLCFMKASGSFLRAARAFEDGRNDLRLAVMGHQIQFVLEQLRRELRSTDPVIA